MSNLKIDDSAAEDSKAPDRDHVDELKSPGELVQENSEMVTIYVGLTKVKWMLHEAVICKREPFFKSAFQGGFAESSSKAIHLEDDDPKVFKLFVDYLFNYHHYSKYKTISEAHEQVITYFALDVFADKIGSPKTLGLCSSPSSVPSSGHN
ncbi:hypothetical protein BKA64DRAFT_703507 [Cadophora sp. MPI-SDFR-AT-0126]|nr:hypothetical protein BKA64DRAFT_703507 [Leotiomycetes sp. MPI-SDFR-AT-0126]